MEDLEAVGISAQAFQPSRASRSSLHGVPRSVMAEVVWHFWPWWPLHLVQDYRFQRLHVYLIV